MVATFSPAPVGAVAGRTARRGVELGKPSRASATANSCNHAGRAGRPFCSGPSSCITGAAQRAHRMRCAIAASVRSIGAVVAVAIALRGAPSVAMRPFLPNAIRLAPGRCGHARFVARPARVPTLPTAAVRPLAVVLDGAKQSRVRGRRCPRRRHARDECSSTTQCGPDQGCDHPPTHGQSPSHPRLSWRVNEARVAAACSDRGSAEAACNGVERCGSPSRASAEHRSGDPFAGTHGLMAP
jgi:hypothetical protein